MKYHVSFEFTRPCTDQHLVEEWLETEDGANDFLKDLIEQKAAP